MSRKKPKDPNSHLFRDFRRAAELLDGLPSPTLPDFFDALEREPNPVIAAVLDSYFAEMEAEADG